jgi:hypothetical protein
MRVVESNTQFHRLFRKPIVLEPFRWDTVKNIAEFRTLLSQLESKLPLRKVSRLDRTDTAWRIFVATEGHIAYVMQLIRHSTVKAMNNQIEYLDKELLAEAFEKMLAFKVEYSGNPFVGDARPPEDMPNI